MESGNGQSWRLVLFSFFWNARDGENKKKATNIWNFFYETTAKESSLHSLLSSDFLSVCWRIFYSAKFTSEFFKVHWWRVSIIDYKNVQWLFPPPHLLRIQTNTNVLLLEPPQTSQSQMVCKFQKSENKTQTFHICQKKETPNNHLHSLPNGDWIDFQQSNCSKNLEK